MCYYFKHEIELHKERTQCWPNINCVYYLVVVEWLACLNDPESYAGGGIADRRVTHAGQVKGDKPDEKLPWSKE